MDRRLDEEHPAAPWLVMRVASVINRGRRDSEGFAAYRRRKGNDFRLTVPEFGQRVVLVRHVGSKGQIRRPVEGRGLAVKARDLRRKLGNGGRWDKVDFAMFIGAPWEPCPGAGG